MKYMKITKIEIIFESLLKLTKHDIDFFEVDIFDSTFLFDRLFPFHNKSIFTDNLKDLTVNLAKSFTMYFFIGKSFAIYF